MRITTQNVLSFQGVTGIIGTPKMIGRLQEEINKEAINKNTIVILGDATDFYRNQQGDGVLTEAAKKGEKCNAFIVR